MSEKDTHLENHLAEAINWEQEIDNAKDSLINAWKVKAILGWLLCTLLVLALIILMPLKTEKIKLLEHDKSTGRVEYMADLDTSKLSEDWAVTMYNINKFVLNYEVYDFHTHDERFANVAALSSRSVYDDYEKSHTRKNTDSLINRLGKEQKIEVRVKNITKLTEAENTVSVRIDKKLSSTKAGVKAKTEPYVITLTYEYVNGKVSEKTRLRNPLGFKVISRTINKELINK